MNEHHHSEESASVPELAQAAHYRFELLFESAVTLDRDSLAAPIASEFESVAIDVADGGLDITLLWGGAQERFRLAPVEIDRTRLRSAIEQSWQWRHAEMMATGSPFALELVHHLGGGTREGRVAMLRRLVAILIRHLTPRAVHLVESMQLADPQVLHEAFTENPFDPLFGFTNIRLYKIEGHEEGITAEYDETIMDTLGLHSFGLPDLQMHFKHLDPSMVAKFLDDYAHYLFEKGPVMETGHTLRGFAGDQVFTCSVESSVLDPWRVVVDVDPGKPYSAGTREKVVVS